uniref:Uncharacterized protein n=1 Tax=Solanum lycopersicum TaxID=4081 RepID=A0A3Q7G1H0_SOLLC
QTVMAKMKVVRSEIAAKQVVVIEENEEIHWYAS